MGKHYGERPPAPWTKRYDRLVKIGCALEKIETQDGTEYDCGHYYPWDCDDCPPAVEARRKEAECRETVILPTLDRS